MKNQNEKQYDKNQPIPYTQRQLREAMTFYQTCLGGESSLQTVAETPMADQCPAGMQQQIMHSILEKNGAVLMATDMTRPEGVKPGNDMAISVNFNSEEEIRTCCSKSVFGRRGNSSAERGFLKFTIWSGIG